MSWWLSSAMSIPLVSWGTLHSLGCQSAGGVLDAHLGECCSTSHSLTSSRVPSTWRSPRVNGCAERLWPLFTQGHQLQAVAVTLCPVPCWLPWGRS